MAEAASVLESMLRDKGHVYLSEMPSLDADSVRDVWARLLGHKQVPDAYLVRLARAHGARVVTFDGGLAALGSAGEVELLGSI